jgi:glutamyl/glutaminyl-tRNA synthetase
VTEVVRGADLLEATAVQVRLHEALALPRPTWLHVPVLLGPDGRKLSKSHGSTAIRSLRAAGWSAERVWAALLPALGQPPGPLHRAGLVPTDVPRGPFTVTEEGRVVPCRAT